MPASVTRRKPDRRRKARTGAAKTSRSRRIVIDCLAWLWLLLSGATLVAEGQLEPVWKVLWDAGTGTEDRALDAAIDPRGYIYVTGSSRASSYGPQSCCTVCLDPGGETVWSARQVAPRPSENTQAKAEAIALGPDGSAYVLAAAFYGHTNVEPFLVKYGELGRVEWSIEHPSSTGQRSTPRDVAVDQDGSVYCLCVTSASDGGGSVYELSRYNPAGERIWSCAEAGPVAWTGSEIQFFPTGKVSVVAGTSYHPHDPEGSLAGAPVTAPSADFGQLAVWRPEGVYVAGQGPLGQSVLHADTNDVVRWTAHYFAPNSWHGGFVFERISDAVVDPDGCVYTTGISSAGGFIFENQPYFDCLTSKLAPDGQRLWVARLNYDLTSTHDEGWHLLVDRRANVFVAGLIANQQGVVMYDGHGVRVGIDLNGSGYGDRVVLFDFTDQGEIAYVTTRGRDFLIAKYRTRDEPNQPILTQFPRPLAFRPGEPATLSAAAIGQGTLLYEWRQRGQEPRGPAAPDLPELQLASDHPAWWVYSDDEYSIIVSNEFGAVESPVTRVLRRPALSVSRNPTNDTVDLSVDLGSPYYKSFTIETSANFRSWTALTNVLSTARTMTFTNLGSDPSGGFFRIQRGL